MSSDRLSSIDIMRGLTLLLMLFVNDLNMDVAPAWLGHMDADFDGMGLADWVFPGFLFMVGMAIPFSFSKKISQGATLAENSRHILTRTISLLIIGVLMFNTGRVNPELTGMSKNLWAILMYLAVFLVWNNYKDKDSKFFTITGLRLTGIALLVILVFKFRSGLPENEGSLITGWWGILGLIGWGYLVSAFIYLLCRDSIPKTIAAAVFFLILNILSGLKYLELLNPVKPLFGVIIGGNVPFIVLTGLTAGLMIRTFVSLGQKMVIQYLLIAGALCLFAGLILRNWFILSKIQATPSWGLVCCGISFFVFTLIYIVTDVYKKRSWASFFRPAGENSLTTYLAPDILYYLIWITGIPVLFYKQLTEPFIVVAGSIAWAVLMIWLTALLKRLGISLKL
jgi:heparan-alpha-glucosaminide N-acetyltransferase